MVAINLGGVTHFSDVSVASLKGALKRQWRETEKVKRALARAVEEARKWKARGEEANSRLRKKLAQ